MNRLFKNLLEVYPKAAEWAKSLHLVVQPQHNDFCGNDCQKLMQNTSKLRSLATTRAQKAVVEPFEITEVSTFKYVNNTRKIHYPMMVKKYQIERIDNMDMDDFRKAVELIVSKSMVNSE